MLVGWGLSTRRGSVALSIVVMTSVLAAFALLTVGSRSDAAPGGLGAARAAASTTGTTISTRTTSLGLIAVGKSHHTVYLFTKDTPKHSTCGTTCRKTWHRVKTDGAPNAGSGIKQSKLSQTSKHQVTYYGHPLYYFDGDSKAGQTKGQGLGSFGGHWWVVSPQGKAGTGATIRMHSTTDGLAVSGAKSLTVYMLTTDTGNPSSCTASGACTTTWPPLITTGKPHAGTGTSPGLLGTFVRGNGARQVTYNHHRLYYFAGDSTAGDDEGQCFPGNPGKWYILDAAGHPIKTQNGESCTSSPTPTDTSTTTGPPPPSCSTHPADGEVWTTSNATLGTILVDSVGCTLYLFQGDTRTAGTSTCTVASGCYSFWKPMVSADTPTAHGSASSGLLDSFTRSDPSGTQLTYNGWPLYYYYNDSHPGNVNGQNAHTGTHYWYVVGTDGNRICLSGCHST
jgi:predicted lipoprotein with Yx(FWY)xxD motif